MEIVISSAIYVFYALLILAALIFIWGNKVFGLVMFSVLFLGACALIYYLTHNIDGEPAVYMRKLMFFSFLAGLAVMVYNLAKLLLVN
ncbi:MAG: hypothetical protein WC668_00495 [Patescibacteria group bacterium]|jgi:hypothetical protein